MGRVYHADKKISRSSQTLQDFFSFNLILEKPWTQSLLQWSCSMLPNSVVGSLLPDQSLTWHQLMESLVQGLVSRTVSKGKIIYFACKAPSLQCKERIGKLQGVLWSQFLGSPQLQPFLSAPVPHEDLGVSCWNFTF